MLEKIVNISAGSDYKQSSKPGARSKVLHYLNEYHPTGNDSISLSPATAYLSIIGWKLKKIKIEKEKIHIGFFFDNMDFSTTINPGEISQLPPIEYLIKYSVETFASILELNAKIISPVSSGISESEQVKIQFPAIRKFFDLAGTFYGSKTLISSDDYEVQHLFSEMGYSLLSEFLYMNKSLITFLEKFLSIKINTLNNGVKTDDGLTLKFLQIIKPD